MTDQEIYELLVDTMSRHKLDFGWVRRDPRLPTPEREKGHYGHIPEPLWGREMDNDQLQFRRDALRTSDDNPDELSSMADYVDAFLSAYGYRYGRDGNGFETYTNHRKRKEVERAHDAYNPWNFHGEQAPFPEYYGPGA